MQQHLQQARQLIADARRVVALTGAGISAESGIRTFRDPGGLWRNFRPEDLATPEAFKRDPVTVWEWYQWRRQLIAAASPNAGHLALVRLQQRQGLTLITQNVDGLHDRAGSTGILKLHGDIWTLRCTACGHAWHDETHTFAALPPPCERCGAMARPGVVWFGEALPEVVFRQAAEAAAAADLFLVIGTSAVVFPAASLIRQRKNCTVMEINIERTAATSNADLALRGPAGEILPQLVMD